RADVSESLARIAKDHGFYTANRARASLSTLFPWALAEGLVELNPVIGTNRPAEEIARDRVLSKTELRAVWRSTKSGDYGDIAKLLILTDQRREEVGGMLWSELQLDAGLWRIGAARTKNGREHEVPL